MGVQVAAFYCFVAMAELPPLRVALQELAAAGQVRGTILLAEEGVNGTISGPEAGVQAVLARVALKQGRGVDGHRAVEKNGQTFWNFPCGLELRDGVQHRLRPPHGKHRHHGGPEDRRGDEGSGQPAAGSVACGGAHS